MILLHQLLKREMFRIQDEIADFARLLLKPDFVACCASSGLDGARTCPWLRSVGDKRRYQRAAANSIKLRHIWARDAETPMSSGGVSSSSSSSAERLNFLSHSNAINRQLCISGL